MPYGGQFSEFFLFKYGKYGVQLFFLLSGFVIYMTLERSRSIPSFLYKRWLRLFPAMLVCSLIIFFTVPFLTARPAGIPVWTDLLPGLLLMEPHYLSVITGLSFNPLEGAFWSIYVEVKFYLFAAVVYFFVSKSLLPWYIVAAYLFWWMVVKAPVISEISFLEPLRWRLHFTSLEYFGWFACGCFCYQYINDKGFDKIFYALLIGLVCICVESKGDSMVFFALAAVLSLFLLSLKWSALQRTLSSRILLLIGFISYPFYLLHENMMVSIIRQLSSLWSFFPSYFYILVSFLSVAAISYIVARHLESNLRRLFS